MTIAFYGYRIESYYKVEHGFDIWYLSTNTNSYRRYSLFEYLHEYSVYSILACHKNGEEILVTRSNYEIFFLKASSKSSSPVNKMNQRINILVDVLIAEESSILICRYSDRI